VKFRYRTVNVRDGNCFRIKCCVVEKLESLQITGKIAGARGRLVERAVVDQLSYFGGLFVWALMLQRCYMLSQFEDHEGLCESNIILKLGKSNLEVIPSRNTNNHKDRFPASLFGHVRRMNVRV
jgi:hypothetical protein